MPRRLSHFLILAGLSIPLTLLASSNVVFVPKVLIDTTVLTADSPSAISTAWNVDRSQFQSLQCTVECTSTPHVIILATGSIDTVTFGGPSYGPTVTSIVTTGTVIVPLSSPPVQQFKIQALLGNTFPTTIRIVGGAQ